MAVYHAHIKVLSRSGRNTVAALAYRAGVQLSDERTGEVFNYRNKHVEHSELLLPDNAPEWAINLKNMIESDREKGVQKLSNIAEASEKRIDAQVYKEFEFALPNELTSEQNKTLINEFLKDQFCKRGITVLANFHNDYDKKDGQNKPHCHAVMLTRELTEEGLSPYKNREWNDKSLLAEWREQLAAYTNFHLHLHGHQSRVDHRSYAEQGLDIEAQPKLSRSVKETEARLKDTPAKNEFKAHTDKAQEYHHIKLKNMYRIMKNPDLVFDIIHKSQATFMWGDVEKVLARYIDDPEVYQAYQAKLKSSSELKLLRETKQGDVYTTKPMIKRELSLVNQAKAMSQESGFEVSSASVEKHIGLYDKKFEKYGGLSFDQKEALAHILDNKKLVSYVGYAGTGKSAILSCAKDIWEENGYKVYALAPTGKATQNLRNDGINGLTVHKFLTQYEQGRSKFNSKSVLILDEAGMVDVTRYEELMSAVGKLGVKLVNGGDGKQLLPIGAVDGFRLVTKETGVANLETVIRQEQKWMKDATRNFGRGESDKALTSYMEKGYVNLVNEAAPDIKNLLASQNYSGLVEAFNMAVRSQKLAGWTFRSDIDLTDSEKAAGSKRIAYWKGIEKETADAIANNIEHCKKHIITLKTDPQRIAENVCQDSQNPKHEAKKIVNAWNLDSKGIRDWEFICNPRANTMATLLSDWHKSVQAELDKSQIIMTYTLKETELLNIQARELRQNDGIVEKKSFTYNITRIDEDDFGEEIKTDRQRSFSKGDRLLFMKNDNGLNVRNGMVGTIEEISQSKLMVRLDAKAGEEAKTVSFAPKLYPFFDLGWAINVNKQQGATNDKSFVLASNHFNSNLSYVALTRHREEAYIYGNSQEFWTESVFVKQLSKSQGKLSSLDYIDSDQALKLVHQENSIISAALERVGNQLNALHYTAKRGLNRWLGSEPLFTKISAQDTFTETQRFNLLQNELNKSQSLPSPGQEGIRSWQEALADFEKQDMEKRILEGTEKTLDEYLTHKNQILQGTSGIPHQEQPSWQDALDKLTTHQHQNGLNEVNFDKTKEADSDKPDYRAQFEKDIDAFKDSYQAYKQSEQEGRASDSELKMLQQKASTLSKDENAMWYLSSTNPDMQSKITNLANEHDRQQQNNRDNGLSR